MSIRHPALIAVLAIMFANISLSLNDALIKQSQGVVGLWSIFWLRSLVSLPLVIGITAVFKTPLWPAQFWGVSLRTGLLLVGWVCLYSALPLLPIANATAAVYTIPIMIVVMTTVLDRSRPSVIVVCAVMTGFVGVILIVQPQNGSVSPAYILPLISAVTYAVAMIFSNRRLKVDHPLTIAVNLNLGFILLGFFGVLVAGDNPIQVLQFAIEIRLVTFAYMGLCLVIGTIGVAVAYQTAAPTLVSTFDYCYLIFAIFWGIMFFDEIPTMSAIIGMGLIVAAGVLILRRT